MWLKVPDVATVNVHTDALPVIMATRRRRRCWGSAQQRGVISKQTEREESARCGIFWNGSSNWLAQSRRANCG